MPVVYLLHAQGKVGRCQHYLGTADDVVKRLGQHRKGQGAVLTREFYRRGIWFNLVAKWDGGRDLERKMKAWKNHPRICPVCRKSALARRRERRKNARKAAGQDGRSERLHSNPE